ncbi:MAG: hypothetical protein WC717_06210, partial [Candidatus Micrarchaeia archaeon]
LFPERPFSTEPATFATRKADQELLNFLDNGLEYMQSKGLIEASVKMYNASYWYKADIGYVEVK